ncbi:DNA-processing protein DprA [Martelella sp. AD-3]|uniref:DNA-processing protein DprA n=1 Tax=Martelella sp. AD-3 TaxID=686597 RepID=UPI00046764F8|nr:DNA-processing protein DprA [Martelella sp. AD-3]AMM85296.1 DNA processing protein DprA [Martelella sp. AD-3]MAM09984.1 DNA-protecting protein DprA [Rhizobiaceae bacterium]
MSPSGISLSESQRIAWLRLIRSDNVGPATFRELINHCGSAEKALDMLPELAKRGGAMKRIRVASIADAEREMEAAARHNGRFVAIGEPDYPPALRAIDGAPPLLAMCGSGETATRPTLGIVGARNASVAGAKFAAMIAAAAAGAGYTVASGLARGIDAAAHHASLKHGTLAALAGGLDRIYPPENTELYHRICREGGVAISEMPYGWEPRARDFPRRNRLIAGSALAVVVVEAAMRSGSLITARLANEAGRLVLAVPGSPLDPRAQGSNGLIKQGAMIVCSPEDVLEALAPLSNLDLPFTGNAGEEPEPEGEAPSEPAENDRQRVAEALGPSPCEIDDLIRFTGVNAATVQLILLELDLAGRLVRHPGGRISLA